MLTVGLYALIRASGDGKRLTLWTCVQIALIAALLSSGLDLFRLTVERLVFLLGNPQPEELRRSLADIVNLLAGLAGDVVTLSTLALFLRPPARPGTMRQRGSPLCSARLRNGDCSLMADRPSARVLDAGICSR